MTERKKPNNKRLILMIVLLAVVIALMWLLPDGSQPAAPVTDAPKTEQTKNTNDTPDDIEATTLVKAGTQAPDFRVEMFDGTTFTLGSLRGKVVLLNFWATWCGPCRQFGPVFEEASEKHPDVVFGKIDTDDQQQLAMAAQITSIPTLMAFRDGIAVFRQSGALPRAALEDLISQIQNLDMDDVRAKIAEADKAE